MLTDEEDNCLSKFQDMDLEDSVLYLDPSDEDLRCCWQKEREEDSPPRCWYDERDEAKADEKEADELMVRAAEPLQNKRPSSSSSSSSPSPPPPPITKLPPTPPPPLSSKYRSYAARRDKYYKRRQNAPQNYKNMWKHKRRLLRRTSPVSYYNNNAAEYGVVDNYGRGERHRATHCHPPKDSPILGAWIRAVDRIYYPQNARTYVFHETNKRNIIDNLAPQVLDFFPSHVNKFTLVDVQTLSARCKTDCEIVNSVGVLLDPEFLSKSNFSDSFFVNVPVEYSYIHASITQEGSHTHVTFSDTYHGFISYPELSECSSEQQCNSRHDADRDCCLCMLSKKNNRNFKYNNLRFNDPSIPAEMYISYDLFKSQFLNHSSVFVCRGDQKRQVLKMIKPNLDLNHLCQYKNKFKRFPSSPECVKHNDNALPCAYAHVQQMRHDILKACHSVHIKDTILNTVQIV